MAKLSSFSDFLRARGNEVPVKEKPMKELEESTFLCKGYSLTQATKHCAAASQVTASANKIISLANRGKNERDIAKKLNILFDALEEQAKALKHQAEMSSANNNSVTAANVLGQNVEAIVKKAVSVDKK